jgi:hypothetical protein
MIRACFVAAALCAATAIAQDDSTSITIYSTAEPGAVPPSLYRPVPPGVNVYQNYQYQGIPGYAVVRQDRTMTLPAGRSEQRFTGVAALLDPTTVRFESLTDPEGTTVLEQDYRFDLVSQQALLERYLDREIGVWQSKGDTVELVRGTLLSASGGLILDTGDGLRTINGYTAIEYPSLPGGLLTRPTLVWDLQSAAGGEQQTRLSYQTDGMTWWADYNLVYEDGKDANSGLLDVGAWVSIINKSGAAYENAKLKLVAGDVQRVQPQGQVYPMAARGGVAMNEAAQGFVEKSFFEYHLYTLGRPTTLAENATKQIELFSPATGVPAEKVLVYYGLSQGYRGYFPNPMTDRNLGFQANTKVDIYLKFRNSEESGLGIPLPKGRICVSKLDPADGSLEFIGEDVIDHTPKNEDVLIKLGSAFDVVGERVQTDFRIDTNNHWMDETIEIKVRNHKDEAVNVIVKENLYRWVNWEITKTTTDFEKVDARTVHFPVSIEPDGEAVIRYTVHYSW